jgi:hypothetical protein
MRTIPTAHCKTEMSHVPPTAGRGIALAAESGAPIWVQLLPEGPEITGRDTRNWTIRNPQAVVAASLARGPLHIDYEHASEHRAPLGLEAPAAGWITALEARETGIWAQVEWTPRAAQMIAEREYRFISPTFIYDGKTNEIVEIVSAGLREAACWAHLRRDFHDVWTSTSSPIAKEALALWAATERHLYWQSAKPARLSL